MKCGRVTCNKDGVYQPLIRIRPAILPANGEDLLATIRPKMVLCTRCKLQASNAEMIALVPEWKMQEVTKEARRLTGSMPNLSRTGVDWIRITGRT